MKHLLNTMAAIAIIALAIPEQSSAKSNYFVGGQIGITTTKLSTEYKSSTGSFSIYPEFGYMTSNNNWIVGLRLSYSYGNTDKSYIEEVYASSSNTSNISNSIGVNPYAMLRCFNAGPVEFWIEGNLKYNYVYTKVAYEEGSPRSIRNNTVGIHFLPVVSWKPFEHFSFFSELNFISLGYSYNRASGDTNYSYSGFNFGVDSHNFLSLSNFTIGFRYWF